MAPFRHQTSELLANGLFFCIHIISVRLIGKLLFYILKNNFLLLLLLFFFFFF